VFSNIRDRVKPDAAVAYYASMIQTRRKRKSVLMTINNVSINIEDIDDSDRIRKDYADVQGLAASIQRFGIIQPIILQRDTRPNGPNRIILVAGGRRLAALRLLKRPVLYHGTEFVWREEDLSSPTGLTRLQAVELEENLRRTDLHWSETILGKQKLLDLMCSIHGGAVSGRGNEGFGVRSLAAMLGENPSTTSRDLELAGFVTRHPDLAKMPTAADARRKLGVAVTVAIMQQQAKSSVVAKLNTTANSESARQKGIEAGVAADASIPLKSERWVLHDGRFQDNITAVDDESVDLVLTDLPYNIGLGTSTATHAAGLGSFADSDIDMPVLCNEVAQQAFRVLKNNRFAVFFYGMNYHETLFSALSASGFTVDVYPFIWLRDRSAPPDGFARYSKSYDPAFIASKGTPRFIRPNLSNSIAIPSVRGPERLHSAQKPLLLMQKFIEDMTTPDCIVLDMFAGAGTTGEAALRTKRKAILFEMEPHNCILIRSRLGAL
jgi:site-specific DNA-methyltransferase (adenine-specific)